MDDVNPIISSRGLSKKEHDSLVNRVNQVIDEEGGHEHLSWDQSKETRVDLGRKPRTRCKLLGVEINSDLDFRKHVAERTRKAKGCLNILLRLSNSHSGISPKAARALHTGCIGPILTYGAEGWHNQGTNPWDTEIVKVQNQALRAATGAYRGSSVAKVGLIANVEPL